QSITHCRPTSMLQRSRDLRDLHSFPTRRSSDLPKRCERWTIWCARARSCTSASAIRRLGWCPLRTRLPSSGVGPNTWAYRSNTRSEEHTSELQSRENLVCRLLLEKKNKSTYNKM